jgi:amidase
MDEFPTALGLAELIRTKQASPVEVMDDCLARIDKFNPLLNVVIWRNDDDARRQARQAADVIANANPPAGGLPPFLGVPLPVKDLTAAAGQPLTYGSFGASDEPQAEDELVVAAFRQAGFILTGRTNTPELGTVSATENDRFGIARNPWNTDRTPGGSSGGAAAAVASGMFGIAHGNDGGGSIRVPASCCGLVGLKVSRGRVPSVIESWEGASVEGVLTHTVTDTAALLDIISGPDPLSWYNAPAPTRPFRQEVGADPGRLRIGLVETAPLGLPVADACRDAVQVTGSLLEELGHSVEPTTFDLDFDVLAPFIAVVNGSYTQLIADWEKCEPHNRTAHQRGLASNSLDYVRAVGALQRWSRNFVARWGRDFDVLVSPTMSIEPPPAGAVLRDVKTDPDNPSPTVFAMVVFTAPFNINGLPAISLPLHQASSGLPIGVQFVERPFNDAGLLRLAAQIEAAAPWSDRHPSL